MRSKIQRNSYTIDAIKLFSCNGVFNRIWRAKIDVAVIKVLCAGLPWHAHISVSKSALLKR